jgi:hypothetical protein
MSKTLNIGDFDLCLSDTFKIVGMTIFYKPSTTLDDVQNLLRLYTESKSKFSDSELPNILTSIEAQDDGTALITHQSFFRYRSICL